MPKMTFVGAGFLFRAMGCAATLQMSATFSAEATEKEHFDPVDMTYFVDKVRGNLGLPHCSNVGKSCFLTDILKS